MAPMSTAIVEGTDADDGEKERGAPRLAADVEGTDANTAKRSEVLQGWPRSSRRQTRTTNEVLTLRRVGGFCSRKSFSTDIFILSQRH